jgi:hypothetical protein
MTGFCISGLETWGSATTVLCHCLLYFITPGNEFDEACTSIWLFFCKIHPTESLSIAHFSKYFSF